MLIKKKVINFPKTAIIVKSIFELNDIVLVFLETPHMKYKNNNRL